MALGTTRTVATAGGGPATPATSAVEMTRQWARVLGTALGVAAVTAAGQLGVAYGWGVVRFARAFGADGRWSAHLSWSAWVATVAALAGAAAGARAARRQWPDRSGLDVAQRIAVALAAGVGAAVTVPLTALPARAATLPGADPVLEAVLASLLGAVAGLLLALVTLAVRVVALSVAGTVVLCWTVALAAAATALGGPVGGDQIRVGVPDLAWFGGDARGTLAVLGVPVVALLASVAVAGAARARGLATWQVVAGGLAGPVTLALPYLIAPPRAGEVVQEPAYRGAMVALVTGAVLALLVALVRHPMWSVVRRRVEEARTRRHEAAAHAGYAHAGYASQPGQPGWPEATEGPQWPEKSGRPEWPDPAGRQPTWSEPAGPPAWPDPARYPWQGEAGRAESRPSPDPFAYETSRPSTAGPTSGYPAVSGPDPLEQDTGELPALTRSAGTAGDPLQQDTGELPALTGSAAGLLEQDTGELPALTGSAAGPLEQDTGELPTLTGTPLTGTTSEPSVGPRIPRQAGPQDRSPLFEPLEPVPLPEPPRRRPRSTPEDSATTTDLDTPGSPPLTGRPTDPFGTLTAPQTVAPAAPDTDAGPSQPDGEPAAGPAEEPEQPKKRSRRKGRKQAVEEDETIDWVRYLSGADEEENRPAGRRRLRSDWHEIEQMPIDPLDPPPGRR